MTLANRYRALLRWYPRGWRTTHGEVMLGTLLDAAETEGRTAPTAAESWSIRWAGLGERFTADAALAATVCALLVALVTTAISIFQVGELAQIGGGWIPAVLGQFLAPTLLSFAVLCLLRRARIVLPARTITAFLIAVLAWALAAAAALSWSVRFDEADVGGISSPLALAFPVLLAAAWVVGGCAVFLVTHAVLSRVPRGAQWTAAGSAALLTPPVLGLGTISPMTTALAALAMLFICGVNLRRQPATQPDEQPVLQPSPARRVSTAVRRRAAVFGAITLVISLVGVAFALTGSSWTQAGVDSTRAMQLGLSAGQLTTIAPLLCLAWILQHRRPVPAARRWLGFLLVSLGLAVTALDTIFGFTRSGALPWPGIAVIALGLGVLTFELLRMTGTIRVLLSAATALVLFVPSWGIVVMLGFLVPIAAVVLLMWGLGESRRQSEALITASV